jgi:hypothetical protein
MQEYVVDSKVMNHELVWRNLERDLKVTCKWTCVKASAGWPDFPWTCVLCRRIASWGRRCTETQRCIMKRETEVSYTPLPFEEDRRFNRGLGGNKNEGHGICSMQSAKASSLSPRTSWIDNVQNTCSSTWWRASGEESKTLYAQSRAPNGYQLEVPGIKPVEISTWHC